MDIAGVLSAIVIGLVLGILGRMVTPGAQRIPIWLTILAGIAAAVFRKRRRGVFGTKTKL